MNNYEEIGYGLEIEVLKQPHKTTSPPTQFCFVQLDGQDCQFPRGHL